MNNRMKPGRKLFPCLTLIGIAAGIGVSSVVVQADPLRTHIELLAMERGFELEGVELIGEESVLPAEKHDPTDQIGRLLANYNFVIASDAEGRIARLTIVGLRAAPTVAPKSAPLQTVRDSAEHYVDSVLTGPNGRSLPLRVIVDTGASTLVLPRSLVTPLGFSESDLKDVRVQTANGITAGAMATLQSVRVGDAKTEHVAVTFVEDWLLGGKQLLGMSFLGRFRMTIDGPGGGLQLEERSN